MRADSPHFRAASSCDLLVASATIAFSSFTVMLDLLSPCFPRIKVYPVRKAHCHKPAFAAAAVEYGGCSILEAFTIPLCLLHGLRHIHPLAAFNLDMYAG